ncbi:MAG: MoaD/ThiS family protein [Chloroflexota bacterium]
MNIEIQLFGKLRELVGISTEEVTLATGTKLSDLMSLLGERHGHTFAQQLKNTSLRILINGREYQVLGGVTTILRDRDTVVLLPLIEGG